MNTKLDLLMCAKDTRPNILSTVNTKDYKKWNEADIMKDVISSLQKHVNEIINDYTKETMFYYWDKSGEFHLILGGVPAGFSFSAYQAVFLLLHFFMMLFSGGIV